MCVVRIEDGESFEHALRKFTRETERSGILAELRKRRYYWKPSSIRRKKRFAAIKREALKKREADRRRSRKRR